jgi:hypothetical protein
MNIKELKKEEENFKSVFAPALRTVSLKNIEVKPDNSGEWDSFSDKHDYYVQAFLLNSLEALLGKKLNYLEFSDILKSKIEKQKPDIKETYLYEGKELFSIKISVDESENMYYMFSS